MIKHIEEAWTKLFIYRKNNNAQLYPAKELALTQIQLCIAKKIY